MGPLGREQLRPPLRLSRQRLPLLPHHRQRRQKPPRLQQADLPQSAVEPQLRPQGQPQHLVLRPRQLRHRELRTLQSHLPLHAAGLHPEHPRLVGEFQPQHSLARPLAFGLRQRVARHAQLHPLRLPARRFALRRPLLSLPPQESRRQRALVRKTLAFLHRTDDQLAHLHRVRVFPHPHSQVAQRHATPHSPHRQLPTPQIHQPLALVQPQRAHLFLAPAQIVEHRRRL